MELKIIINISGLTSWWWRATTGRMIEMWWPSSPPPTIATVAAIRCSVFPKERNATCATFYWVFWLIETFAGLNYGTGRRLEVLLPPVWPSPKVATLSWTRTNTNPPSSCIFRELKQSFIFSIAGEESHTWHAAPPTTSSKLELTAKSYFGPNNNLSTLFKSLARDLEKLGDLVSRVSSQGSIFTPPIISVTSFSASTTAEKHPKWEIPIYQKNPYSDYCCSHKNVDKKLVSFHADTETIFFSLSS